MNEYIIDGNNLIGQIKSLNAVHKKDPQGSREKLAFAVDRYFHKKKGKVFIHFDGFASLPIKVSNAKIIYSDNREADDTIKEQIERAKNPKKIILISSDHKLIDFAKVCSCSVQTAENFAAELFRQKDEDEEKSARDSISNEEIKKLFGTK